MKTSIAVVSLVAAMLPVRPCQAAGPFDGTWSVTQDCPPAPDGARSYKFLFDATVQDGQLIGQYGTRDKPSSQTLSGRISRDGSARLMARGLSGKAENTLGFSQSGSAFSFPVTAQFDSRQGVGQRTAGRICNFSFVRK
jgi:hypothetical protein